MRTVFFHDERTLWHAPPHSYAGTVPVSGLVQPTSASGSPESPESKRRLIDLMRVTGLIDELDVRSAPMATRDELISVHDASYLDRFEAMSPLGGSLGPWADFGPGGYEIAALSAGLAIQAVREAATGQQHAYVMTRPPGHHCLPDRPMGYCLLANIAIAVETAMRERRAGRIAVLDWDAHHGNGTEHIFYDRSDVLTISIHQDRNYPVDTGAVTDRGVGQGEGFNLNIPLPPGCGHEAYLLALDSIVVPALTAFAPDVLVVSAGYDASAVDPSARMICGANTFGMMTERLMNAVSAPIVMAHEGGYSAAHVPFCGHAAISTLAGSKLHADDPLGPTISAQQPFGEHLKWQQSHVNRLCRALTTTSG